MPPAWWDQLAPGGRLVVPLRWRGLTRCLTLDHDRGRLIARAVRLCEFIPMQGQDGEQALSLAEGVRLYVDQDAPTRARDLAEVLIQPRAQAWSGVEISGQTPLQGVWMRLACTEPGTGRLVSKRPAICQAPDLVESV